MSEETRSLSAWTGNLSVTEGKDFIMSFRGEPMEKLRFVAKCRKPPEKTVENHLDDGSMFQVEHWFAEVVYIEGENDEMKPVIRVVFVAPDGSRVASMSDGVVKDWRLTAGILGVGPYKPPLYLRPIKMRTNRQRTMYGLEVFTFEDVEEMETAP